MVLLKSKCFWIWTGLGICTAIFFAVVVHRANPPQEVIKVYKAVDPAQPVTPLSPGGIRVSGAPPQTSASDLYARDETSNEEVSGDFSEDTPVLTDAFTDDDFFADEYLP